MLNYVKSNLRKIVSYVGPCLLIIVTIRMINNYHSANSAEHLPYVKIKLPPVMSSSRVLLLSYQRCGSSFTGQILNHNPDAYYVFEPLDAVYVSMYGTSPGWNVPSDITHFWNGSHRTIPTFEHNTVARKLNAVLSCDMQKVPTEFFTHTFWTKFPGSLGNLARYKICLTKVTKSNSGNCHGFIQKYCPERFGENHALMQECYANLKDTTKISDHESTPTARKHAIQKYQKCLAIERRKIHECIQEMNLTCQSSNIRSTKTVRLTMSTVEHMLKLDPNLKVIHLFRDPRPVVLSRMGRKSFRGKFSGTDMLREAQVYCQTVMTDIRTRMRLEKEYPSTFYQLIYEDFVVDTVQHACKVYEFLNIPFSDEVKLWLQYSRPKGNDSMTIATKWQDKVTHRQSNRIAGVCKELFEFVNGVWS